MFRDNFQSIAQRASETGSIVIASHRGVHFANEVLNWHRIVGVDSADILPALLVTETHPNYFRESYDETQSAADGLGKLLLVSFRDACSSSEHFTAVMETVFTDLAAGTSLSNFRVAEHDRLTRANEAADRRGLGRRLLDAVIVQPNFAGIGFDMKEFFGPKTD